VGVGIVVDVGVNVGVLEPGVVGAVLVVDVGVLVFEAGVEVPTLIVPAVQAAWIAIPF
jgi:hypothetical protein